MIRSLNRIDQTFERLKKQGRKALIIYLTAGYPSLREEGKLIPALVQSGVDLLELGIPFSDPIADGPTIQWASQKALENGINIPKSLALVRTIRKTVSTPILFMSYFNPLLNYGLERFFQDAQEAGVDGLIVPDLIPEESRDIDRLACRWNLKMIHFISPTSDRSRQRSICRISDGFIYAVSVTGVTGARNKFPPETTAMLKNLRRLTRKPIVLGFGVSKPKGLRGLLPFVDGVIVASALIDTLRRSKNTPARLKSAKKFLAPLRTALATRPEVNAHAS